MPEREREREREREIIWIHMKLRYMYLPSKLQSEVSVVIFVWNGHGDTSSNPGRGWLSSCSTNTVGKDMNPTTLPLAMDK